MMTIYYPDTVPSHQVPVLEEREDLGPFVYFIRHGEYVKIGTSINPASRLRQLDRWTSKTLRPLAIGDPELIACIPGSARDERRWHQAFASQRVIGEWFTVSEDLCDAILEAHGKQLSIELSIADADPGSELAKAIFFRRFSAIERLTDDEYREMYDSGELEDSAA